MGSNQLPAAIDRAKIVAGDARGVVPVLIAAAGPRARFRFLEFSSPASEIPTRGGPTAAP